MTNWGQKLGRTVNARLGIGVQVAPGSEPKTFPVKYTSFRNGLLLADRPEDIPAGFFSDATDVETSRRDGVIRAPGVTLIEDTLVNLQWLAVHTGLDFQSVLVAFNAPLIGVREAGIFIWQNVGITAGDAWVTSRYGDVMLFSNGAVSYARSFDSGLVTVIPDMPGAATILTAFGRVFAGGVVSGGEFNVLGISWNGVDGDYTDWVGTGAGSELLIADVEQTDKIVAGRVISYDLIAILCRRSLWIGARTGDVARPADLQFRLLGIGCVSEPTAKTTESGVTFLSDEGIRHFDGTNAPIISTAINAELLPIDFNNINLYKAAWDGSRRRYILTTPTATYVYQFKTPEYPVGAWFKRSLLATNVVVFGRQTPDLSWDGLGEQSWDDLGEQTWFQLATQEGNEAPDVLFASGTVYGKQDYAVATNFSNPLNPIFQPRPDQNDVVDLPEELLATLSFHVEYNGSGTIEILAEDEVGVVSQMVSRVLDAVTKPKTIKLDVLKSTRAVGLYMRIAAGNPEILKIKQIISPNGPYLGDVVGAELLSEVATDLLTEASNGIILWP